MKRNDKGFDIADRLRMDCPRFASNKKEEKNKTETFAAKTLLLTIENSSCRFIHIQEKF